MTKTPVRKFADIVVGKQSEPAQSRVSKAFSNIRNTPDGAVIEAFFLHLMARLPVEGAPESALRENAVERRLAARIVRMMNEAEPSDDRQPAATASARGSKARGPKR